MNVACAVLVKTPGYSPVKTRLAEKLGQRRAEEFYRKSVVVTEAVLTRTASTAGHEITPFWAVGEPPATDEQLWSEFSTLTTGPGGLGRRMGNVYNRLLAEFEAVVLLGADSPQLTPGLLRAAVDRLTTPERAVLGPATDGGFYLFGGNLPLELKLWTEVEYSQPETREQFINNLEPFVEPELLPARRDVDTFADLEYVAGQLWETGLEVQADLASWLENELLKSESD